MNMKTATFVSTVIHAIVITSLLARSDAESSVEVPLDIIAITGEVPGKEPTTPAPTPPIIVDVDGGVWCLEANALPGLTANSLLPKAALAAGTSLSELCDRIVGLALARRMTHHGT